MCTTFNAGWSLVVGKFNHLGEVQLTYCEYNKAQNFLWCHGPVDYIIEVTLQIEMQNLSEPLNAVELRFGDDPLSQNIPWGLRIRMLLVWED